MSTNKCDCNEIKWSPITFSPPPDQILHKYMHPACNEWFPLEHLAHLQSHVAKSAGAKWLKMSSAWRKVLLVVVLCYLSAHLHHAKCPSVGSVWQAHTIVYILLLLVSHHLDFPLVVLMKLFTLLNHKIIAVFLCTALFLPFEYGQLVRY